MATYVEIASVTVGSGGASSIDFTSIPNSYTDLKLVASLRVSNSALYADILVRPNSSTSSLSCIILYGNGSAAYATSIADSYGGVANGATSTANIFSNAEWYFPNYSGNANKSFSVDSVWENNSTTASQVIGADRWSNTAAITSLTLSGNFVQYSTAYLYGIKKD